MGISTPVGPASAGIPATVLRLSAAAILSLPLSLAGARSAGAAIHHASTTAGTRARTVLSGMPLRFEQAPGRAGTPALYVAQSVSSEVSVGARGIVLQMDRLASSHKDARRHAVSSAALSMALLGADGSAPLNATQRLPGRTSYFIGRDTRRWRTGVAAYGQIRAAGVYRGIDAVYHGSGQSLEYDFQLAPHAHPDLIRLAFSGAQGLSLSPRGDLLIRLAGGTLRQAAPIAYQPGPHRPQAVAVRFVLLGRTVAGFRLGRYDPRRPLTIDPTVLYGTYLGAAATEIGYSVAQDGHGNIYLDGVASTRSGGAPPAAVPGTLPFPPPATEAVFIAKLRPSGSGAADLVYLDYIGGTDNDTFLSDGIGWGYSLAVDGAGNAYVAGSTRAASFPATAGAYQTSLNRGAPTGASDAFLATVDAAGATLRYATLLGGSDYDFGTAVTVDSAGSAYVTGVSESTSLGSTPFPTTNGSVPNWTAALGYYDVFVARVVPNAALAPSAQLPYSTLIGGSYDDFSSAIALDHSGAILVAGYTRSPDFPGTAGGFQASNPNGGSLSLSGFVARLNLSASTANSPPQLVAATYLGGAGKGDTVLFGLGVDGANNVDVAGYTYDPTYPVSPTAYSAGFTAFPGSEEGVVSQLDPTLHTLRYSTFFGTTNGVYLDVYALAVDAVGTLYITGKAAGPIPVTSGALPLNPSTTPAPAGAFVAEIIPDVTLAAAQQLAFSTLISGGASDYGYGIAVDGNGMVYLAGQYISADGLLPVTAGAYQTAYGGGPSDAFALKLLPIPEAAPRCTVQVTIGQGATRLGLVAATRPAGSPIFPIAYITYQTGANTFVVRRPLAVSCIRPGLGTAVAIVSGSISSVQGSLFHLGDVVTVTVTMNPTLAPAGEPTTPAVEVADHAATPPYDVTLGPPFRYPAVVRVLAQ